MRILLAPDSFKGSLTALEAAEALAAGIRRVRPETEIVLLPLADGGEGTVDALVAATGGRIQAAQVTGPLGGPVDARWGLLGPDGAAAAVVEVAAAAGLMLVPTTQRDPRKATTYGVGELILAAIQCGANEIIVGLGGSATNDGGAGVLSALGVRFLDAHGQALPEKLGGGDLARLAHLDISGLRFPAGGRVKVTIASDVTNPLLGPNGASAVYGPQKGASAREVLELDAALANYAAIIKRDLGKDVAELPGAGAAGGLGAGLMAFLGAEMRSGIDLVLDTAHFDEKLIGANWVWTGEGRIDAQTLNGKAISGVLRRCQTFGVKALAFGGSVDADAAEALEMAGLQSAFPIVSGPMGLEEAMRDGRRLLTEAAARVMRLVG